MEILSILLFLAITFGLGYTLESIFKIKIDGFYERNIMRVGFGLSATVILISLLPLLRIPLDWRIFLILAMAYPAYSLFKKDLSFNKMNPKSFLPSTNEIILFLIFIVSFYMYLSGSFAYPYLEDDDPWAHALGTKYVSIEKTVYEPIEGKHYLIYLDARPPGFDGLMGLLHQVTRSVSWTLKFFNSLIISLSLLFFYYLSKLFFRGSSKKALLATFFLACFPTYLTHFIWAQSLVITTMIVGFYVLIMNISDKKQIIFGSLIAGAPFLVQETTAAKYLAMFLILFFAKSFTEKKINKQLLTILLGAILVSIIVWWGPMAIKYGSELYSFGIREGEVPSTSAPVHPSIKSVNYVGILGSATRQHGAYTFSDIFFAKGQNMINVPIGVGIFLSVLIFLGLIYLLLNYKKTLSDALLLTFLLWFVFVFLGSHGGTRWWAPVAFYTFRFWILFALVGSILAVYGSYLLFSASKKLGIPRVLVIFFLVMGVIFTSGIQKYELNTATWGPGGSWLSIEELQGYLWLKNLPPNTAIFPTNEEGKYRISGLDGYACGWCPEEIEFRSNLVNKDSNEIRDFLKNKKYEYIIFDQTTARDYGVNETIRKIEELSSSGLFSVSNQNQAVVIFKVN